MTAPAVAAPTPTPAPTASAATTRLNLDVPVETIVADTAGKAVLDRDLPGLTTHEMYDTFKGMSLHQLQGYAPDRLTDANLARVATDLAAIH
ncbi:hypothetical protein [Sphingomonas sp.]|uniref:hypothetical protein n=1 Tax=Sphingomonas sp. TaxID=28214 RepID=UPI003CC6BBD0